MPSERDTILRMTEKRSQSIYRQFWVPLHRQRQIHEMTADPQVEMSLKFTGVFAILAHLQFPIQLSDFRSAIPEPLWSTQVQFHYTRFLGGAVPIYTELGVESFYRMDLGKARTPYGRHSVYFAASVHLMPDEEDSTGGTFEPSMDASVSRFTLCHPFLRDELHDADAIYLFTCG